MFGTNTSPLLSANATKSGLTLSKILNGTSKTLNFINQAIPVYYNTKPLIKNTGLLLKAFKNTTDTGVKKLKENVIIQKEKTIENSELNNEIMYSTLTFFQ